LSVKQVLQKIRQFVSDFTKIVDIFTKAAPGATAGSLQNWRHRRRQFFQKILPAPHQRRRPCNYAHEHFFGFFNKQNHKKSKNKMKKSHCEYWKLLRGNSVEYTISRNVGDGTLCPNQSETMPLCNLHFLS
jgi:hypothetical protein